LRHRSASFDQAALQKRVIRTLAAGQILGGIGVASGAAVGALLAADLSSDKFSGLAAASSVTGAALIALPVTRLMNEKGRRPGLQLAYIIGIAGAILVVLGAKIGFFPLALFGLVLFGGGSTATLQSRYSATDLALPQHRGRALGTVVWATTVGSIVGPNLADPMGHLALKFGIPELAGPYLLSLVVYATAFALISIFLTPDPLLAARHFANTTHADRPKRMKFNAALTLIQQSPGATLGLASMVLGQMVMTAVMSMTPVHLNHQGASLGVIGTIISGHITGMYIASPLVGWATDRFGRRPVIIAGALILLGSFLIAGSAPDHHNLQLGIGLFMLGLGWSCTLIAGSTLLTESVALDFKPGVQGAADLTMGMAGASAGLLSGVVVGYSSYAMLTIIATCMILPLLIAAFRRSTSETLPHVIPT
jgi:MFS family permease